MPLSDDPKPDEFPIIIFTMVHVKSTVEKGDLPRKIKLPIWEMFEEFVKSTNAKAPAGMKNLIQTDWVWVFMPTEIMFLHNVIQGICIAIVFSFLVMLIITRNFVVSSIAIVCVAMVITSVLSMMVLNGQELGISESIAVVALIGFSIDYILHYSADYIHSKEPTRDLRMR